MTDAILALNAGSSSIKFGLFERRSNGDATPVVRGTLEDVGDAPRLIAKDANGGVLEERHWAHGASPGDIMGYTLDWIERHLGEDRLVALGHRIVHGGQTFQGPVRLDDDTIAAIDRLTPLAPLHQPRSLEPIRALRQMRSDLPQVGCFDTAFHRDLAPVAYRYAIPRHLESEGIRKYGFHGLSYEYIASRLPDLGIELARKRTIVAHLGQGASLCAMQNGRSLDTTMGFSALDGLVMGTRCGAIDPGVLLHLQRVCGMSADEVENLLYHKSGLLGVSGISADMRVLEASHDPHAKQAIELFVFHAAREAAALANTLGGLDVLVFTGGIGEHSPLIRAAVCERLSWLGVSIEPASNDRSAHRIDDHAGTVEVRVIPTDEELVIARQVIACRFDV